MAALTVWFSWQMTIATLIGLGVLTWSMVRVDKKRIFDELVVLVAACAFGAAVLGLIFEAGKPLFGMAVFGALAFLAFLDHDEVVLRKSLKGLIARAGLHQ